MQFIDRVYNACKAALPNHMPLPLMQLGLSCLLMEHSGFCLSEYHVIREKIKQYFLENYEPEQIPKLFAIILTRYTPIDYVFSPYLLALKYIESYEQQLKTNNLSQLSKIFDKQYPEESVIKGNIFISLFSTYLKRGSFNDGIKFANKTCQFFVNEQHEYSVYASIHGLEFVLEFLEVLVTYDYHISCKYQLRYKSLIKYLIKTFNKLPSCMTFEQQARSMLLLGLYYTHCCNSTGEINGIKARKYALKALKHLNKHSVQSKFLMDAYGLLHVANKSLSEFEASKTYLIMQSKLRIKLNLIRKNLNVYKGEHRERLKILNQLNRQFKRTKINRLRWKKVYSSTCFDANKSVSYKKIGQSTINYWIDYVKNDTYFQILKNIACLKECNFMKCKRKDAKLQKCKQCLSVYYCSREHQKKDWNSNHREQCVKLTSRDYSFTIQAYFVTFKNFRIFNSA